MEIRTVYPVFFSPTGKTLQVVQTIADVWNAGQEVVDLSRRDIDFSRITLTKNDLCIVGVPSFRGRVPDVATERLAQLCGDKTPAIMVVSYGNRAYEDTLLELKDILEAHGFIVCAALAAVTEHSIVRQFAAGRPNARDCDEIRFFAEQVKEHLDSTDRPESICVPGNSPYCSHEKTPCHPSAGYKCNRCGKCALTCPVGAIPVEAPNQTDATLCICCMRCVAVCPRRARNLNKILQVAIKMKLKKACENPKKNEVFLDGSQED